MKAALRPINAQALIEISRRRRDIQQRHEMIDEEVDQILRERNIERIPELVQAAQQVRIDAEALARDSDRLLELDSDQRTPATGDAGNAATYSVTDDVG